MKRKVQLISLEEDDKDLIVAFALDDAKIGVKSLILHRTLFFEELLDEDEKGVNVSLEDDRFDQEHLNMLKEITISNDEISIKSSFREYKLDISSISQSDTKNMISLLKKQNYDNRFTINIV